MGLIGNIIMLVVVLFLVYIWVIFYSSYPIFTIVLTVLSPIIIIMLHKTDNEKREEETTDDKYEFIKDKTELYDDNALHKCSKCNTITLFWDTKGGVCPICGAKEDFDKESIMATYPCPNCGKVLTFGEQIAEECSSCRFKFDKTALIPKYTKNAHLLPENFDLEEVRKLSRKIKRQRIDEKLKPQPQVEVSEVPTYSYIPKCPICGSTDIEKISTTQRVIKTAVFGTIGAMDDAGKTYKCNNCGSKF